MRKKSSLVLSIAAVLLLISGCSSSGPAVPMGAGGPETAVTVEAQEVATGSISETYYAVGTVKAEQEYEVTSDARGNVEDIYVNEGDQVSPGDLLFAIDYTEDINSLEISKRQAEMTVEQNRINMENKLDTYNDSQEIFEAGLYSQSDLDADELSYNQARLTYEQSRASLESLTNQLNSAYKDARVTSPAGGIVGSISIDKGQLYSGTTAMTIVDIDSIVIETQVSDKVINQCAAGQQADIYIPSISAASITGTVKSIGLTRDSLAGSYPVEIQIVNEGLVLKPGMYAEVYLELEKHQDAIVIPKQAIVSEDEVSYVFLADGDKAKKVEITTGIEDGENIEVTGDINKGDLLIVKGQKFVDDGQSISIPGSSDAQTDDEQGPASDNPPAV